MIRAVLENGVIRPVEPLPAQWREGQELLIESDVSPRRAEEIDAWADELEAAARAIPADEHERFLSALAEIEKESKEQARKDWGER